MTNTVQLKNFTHLLSSTLACKQNCSCNGRKWARDSLTFILHYRIRQGAVIGCTKIWKTNRNRQNSSVHMWNIKWHIHIQAYDKSRTVSKSSYSLHRLSSSLVTCLLPCCVILKAGSGDDRPCSSRSWKAVSCSCLSFFSSLLHCCIRLFLTALLRWSSSQSLRAASYIFIWRANSASTKFSCDSWKKVVIWGDRER